MLIIGASERPEVQALWIAVHMWKDCVDRHVCKAVRVLSEFIMHVCVCVCFAGTFERDW